MELTDVSIATITWARDSHEEATLRKSLERLSQLNVPVYITDAGSQQSFLDFLRGIPHFHVQEPPKKGVWLQTHASLLAAYEAGTPFIFYTEPDKADFFAQALPDFLRNIQANAQLGVWLASRSAPGFTSFPTFQQMTETAINQCCVEIIGEPIDYVYGPFLLNRKLVPYLQKVEPTLGWGWRPFTFHLAKRLSYRVGATVGDFYCPLEQREDTPNERIYRMRQLTQNIEGLTLSTTVSLEE
jgi:hypothetical protein